MKFIDALAVLLIGLKLLGYINWSWWLVLLPVYGKLLFIVLLIIIGVATGAGITINGKKIR